MENYQCHITINNRTAVHLRCQSTDLPWGTFQSGPADDVLPKSETMAFVATGSPGVPAGTEGTVVYQFQDDANVTITIYWDIPTRPFSHNIVTATSSNPDVAATVEGLNGSGATEVCTVRVVDGR